MTQIEWLLQELHFEAEKTRKTLERVPEKEFAWRPHERSMTLQKLASHLGDLLEWAVPALTQTEIRFEMKGHKSWEGASRAEILAKFDSTHAAARKALANARDEDLTVPWSLIVDGKTLFTQPRGMVLRTMVFNHMVHHRAQLGVYLRMLGVPVPAVYGPSADERP